MLLRLFLGSIVGLAIVSGQLSSTAAEKADAEAQLKALIEKVQAKIGQDKKTEADYAGELKEFDALLTEHKAEKTDAVARILLMKGMLYVQILDNFEKGMEVLKKLKTEFPETDSGKDSDRLIAGLQKQNDSKKVQESLKVGSEFPGFLEKDLQGKPLSIANYKGKAVLIDFWATWCGPCVGELPNVLKTYQAHHGEGFDIIGISLDRDRSALTSFIKKHEMPWAQYFDGKGWDNKLAGQYGIQSIPATFLLDGEGKIVAKDLRGEALEEAVAKLVKKQ